MLSKSLFLLFLSVPLVSISQKRIVPGPLQDSIRVLMIRSDENLKTNPAQAEQFALAAHELAILLKDVRQQASISFQLGKIYFFLHKDELSLQAFNHAADLYLEENDSVQAALALNGAGNVYLQKRKNFTEALKRYDRAMELLKNDSVTAIRVLNNIGTIYNRSKRYEEALKIYERVFSVAQSQKDLLNMSASLNNIGSVYDHLQNYQSSVSYYLRSIEIKEAYNDYSGIANTLTNLGIAYQQMHKYRECEETLRKALELAHQYNFTDVEIYAKVILSELYADTERSKLAIHTIKEAEQLARKSGVTFHNGSIYKKLSQMYDLTGQMELALHYQKKYAAFNDSITQLERKSVTTLVGEKDAAETEPAKEEFQVPLWVWLVVAGVACVLIVTVATIRKRSEETSNDVS